MSHNKDALEYETRQNMKLWIKRGIMLCHAGRIIAHPPAGSADNELSFFGNLAIHSVSYQSHLLDIARHLSYNSQSV